MGAERRRASLESVGGGPFSLTAPWLVSIGLHAALFIASLFIVWAATQEDRTPRAAAVSFDDPAPPPIAPAPAEEKLTPPEEAAATTRLDEALEAIAAPTAESIAEMLERHEAPPPSLVDRELSAAEAPPIDPAAAAPRRVEFAGLGASDARDIVYVVDASGSMITTMPEVVAQLMLSIERLHPTQRFTVLLAQNRGGRTFLFPDLPAGAKKPVLLDATRRSKQAIRAWLEQVDTGGGSDPGGALAAALGLKPDAVFLLASRITGPEAAEFGAGAREALLARLDDLNPVRKSTGDRRVVIKAIQVIEEDPYRILRAIGEAHGGEDGYKFISREEFNAAATEGRRGG